MGLAVCGRAAAAKNYVNPTYGFSVLLPNGLDAQAPQPPSPQHGFLVDLRAGDRIWVDGSYDSRFLGSPEAALQDLAGDIKHVGSLTPRLSRIAGLPAASWRFSNGVHVGFREVARRDQPSPTGILYTFGLDSDPAHAAADMKTMERILRSFELRPLPP